MFLVVLAWEQGYQAGQQGHDQDNDHDAVAVSFMFMDELGCVIGIAQSQEQKEVVRDGEQIIPGLEIRRLRKLHTIAQVGPTPCNDPDKDGETQVQQTFVDTPGRVVLLQDLFKPLAYIIPDGQQQHGTGKRDQDMRENVKPYYVCHGGSSVFFR
jgi:hypothetical protein